jgi:flagellar motility protein MotE (MotC chaperone)
MRFRIRLLPAALVAAGLLLAGKAIALYTEFDAVPADATTRKVAAALQDLTPGSGAPEKAATDIKAETKKAAADAGKQDGKNAAATSSGVEPAAKSTPDQTPKQDAEKKAAATTSGELSDEAAANPADAESTGARLGLEDEDFDPMMLSRAEIELLQELSQRRTDLERREREFALKQQTLAAAEQKLDAKIAELETLKKTVESLLVTQEQQQEVRLKSLVKIYESMKPKEAARIFDSLEADTLLDVVERMKESKTAPILALLNPDKAKSLTEGLAIRHTLPKPGVSEPPR